MMINEKDIIFNNQIKFLSSYIHIKKKEFKLKQSKKKEKIKSDRAIYSTECSFTGGGLCLFCLYCFTC